MTERNEYYRRRYREKSSAYKLAMARYNEKNRTSRRVKAMSLELRRWREEKGITQTALAEKVGTTQSMVCRWENAWVPPNAERLEKVDPELAARIRRAGLEEKNVKTACTRRCGRTGLWLTVTSWR